MVIDFSVFTKTELQTIKKLNTPWKVQEFVTALSYNTGDRISIAQALRKRKSDCLEAASLASVILSYHHIPNFIIDLTSVRDEDHVLCIFQQQGKYGAIGQSKFLGLRFRNPVYASLHELAMSYFENYFNFFGEYTLRGHSTPLQLNDLNRKQLTDPAFMHYLEDKLNKIKHAQLVKNNARFPRVPREKFRKELEIIPKNAKIGKQYV